ncbi:MAG TPA: nucleotidyltransferase [Thermoanaerobaculia bacterium]|nr:nucleotidyltransferase [Thermoanaerobaculia bacterium]
MLPAAVELLTDLAGVAGRWGRWYVFGAQAVIAHGVPRLSADVDVTLEIDPEQSEGFAAEMEEAGFDLVVDDPEFLRRTRVMPFVHRSTGMPLDVVLAGSGLEDEFLRRARPIDVGGAVVPLIDIEDLIIAKILAGRPKDVEDVRGLWAIHGSRIDRHRVRRLLEMLQEALSQGDLIPTLDSIIASAER